MICPAQSITTSSCLRVLLTSLILTTALMLICFIRSMLPSLRSCSLTLVRRLRVRSFKIRARSLSQMSSTVRLRFHSVKVRHLTHSWTNRNLNLKLVRLRRRRSRSLCNKKCKNLLREWKLWFLWFLLQHQALENLSAGVQSEITTRLLVDGLANMFPVTRSAVNLSANTSLKTQRAIVTRPSQAPWRVVHVSMLAASQNSFVTVATRVTNPTTSCSWTRITHVTRSQKPRKRSPPTCQEMCAPNSCIWSRRLTQAGLVSREFLSRHRSCSNASLEGRREQTTRLWIMMILSNLSKFKPCSWS